METAPVAAFEQFVRRFRQDLLLSAAAMCGEWHAADDLVQEGLIVLHRRWHDVEPAARGAYVRTVMAHLVTREHRSVRWQRESLCELLPELPAWPEQEDVADRGAVRDAVAGLPVRQRSAVYLRYWGGLSTDEIARALRVPAGTVRSDLTRAAVRLKGVLQISPTQLAVGDSQVREAQTYSLAGCETARAGAEA
jgi:RNA polymerase sigma factor (sigma-70 family)